LGITLFRENMLILADDMSNPDVKNYKEVDDFSQDALRKRASAGFIGKGRTSDEFSPVGVVKTKETRGGINFQDKFVLSGPPGSAKVPYSHKLRSHVTGSRPQLTSAQAQ
jgi:hypothetical protein